MRVYQLNKPLFDLPAEHPTRRFLEAFVECRQTCVGQELPPPFGQDCDQEWWSSLEQKQLTYSWSAYSYLSFDVELDGWLSGAPARTESETKMLSSLPHMQTLMTECREAAIGGENQTIIEKVDKILAMLDLWKECIEYRVPTGDAV